MSIRKSALAVCLFGASSGVALGVGCPAVIDGIWQAGITASGTSISAAVTTAAESIASARVVNTQWVQSALRVLAKQIEVSGDKISVAELSSKQASAAFASELANRKAVYQTTMEYSPSSGQGYDPCGEVTRTQRIAVAIGEANSSVQERVLKEIDAAPGRVIGNQATVVAKRLVDARTTYCTEDEAKAGVCSAPGAMAGKDRDAAHFFTTYQVGTPEAEAKNAMLNNMYGVPPVAPTGDAAKSPTGQSFFATKRSYDAFRSISQATMKSIQSWTESRGSSGNALDSVLNTISKKVATYSGGENYKDWENQLAAQSEHGLLVELAKKRAFQLYMHNLEYQQFELIEANVAALVALKSSGQSGGAEGAQARAGSLKVQ